MNDIVELAKLALSDLNNSTYGGSAESGAIMRICRETKFIVTARGLIPEMIAEIEWQRAETTEALRRTNEALLLRKDCLDELRRARNTNH